MAIASRRGSAGTRWPSRCERRSPRSEGEFVVVLEVEVELALVLGGLDGCIGPVVQDGGLEVRGETVGRRSLLGRRSLTLGRRSLTLGRRSLTPRTTR